MVSPCQRGDLDRVRIQGADGEHDGADRRHQVPEAEVEEALAGAVLGEPDYGQRSLLAIGVQFGVITALLSAKGFGARIEQTLSAISGTGVLFGLASIYLLSLIDPERPQAELAAVYLLLFFWSLAVDGHIYRRALSSKMGLGVLVAVSIFALNFILLKALFG